MARHTSRQAYEKAGKTPPWIIRGNRPPVFTPEQRRELNKLIAGMAWLFMPADPQQGNRPTLRLGRLGLFVGSGAEILAGVREAVRARGEVAR